MLAVAGVTICMAASPYLQRAAVVVWDLEVAAPVTPVTAATDQAAVTPM